MKAGVRAFSLGVVLFATWILLSGHFTPLLLGLGVASCAGIVFLAMRMDVVDREGFPVQLSIRLIGYWVWLLVEIVKANIDVTRRIWSPRLPISPSVFHLRMSQPSELGQVVYANSITLTPGTVAIRLHQDEILVHAVAEELGEDLAGGAMDARVTRLEAGKS